MTGSLRLARIPGLGTDLKNDFQSKSTAEEAMRIRTGEFAGGVEAVRALLLATLAIIAEPRTTLAQQGTDPYPFVVGNYWIYQGRVTQPAVSDGQGRVPPPESKEMTWRSEITQVVYRKHQGNGTVVSSPTISAAVFDNVAVAKPDGSKLPGILINVDSNYEIRHDPVAGLPSEIPGIMHRVQDRDDNLADLVRNNLVLDLPLSPGKHWGASFFSGR
jgi:hypothetical protein